MRTRLTMTISLPREMIQEVERVRKAEHRTRSELVREALRAYFVKARPYAPAAAERREIANGRAAMRRGDFYSAVELRGAVGGAGPEKRRESRAARSKARVGAAPPRA